VPSITIRPKDWLVADYYKAQMALAKEDVDPSEARPSVVGEIRRIQKRAKASCCDIMAETVYQAELDSDANSVSEDDG